MLSSLKLNIEELQFSPGSSPFKGRLHFAAPTLPKPHAVGEDDWRELILTALQARWQSHIVIPRSFWPDNKPAAWAGKVVVSGYHWIDLMDTFVGVDGDTPRLAAKEVIDCLARGEDVAIVSADEKVSGFLPAIIGRLIHPDCHIVKLWYPIMSNYNLNDFQLGYLYGMSDAGHYESINGQPDSESVHEDDLNTNKGWFPVYDDDGAFERQASAARAMLEAVSRELYDEITPELVSLTTFLNECSEHPAVFDTMGCFGSIIYRLCDVFKATMMLGFDTLEYLKEPPVKGGITAQLAADQVRLGFIADQLENHLCSPALSFLFCDLDVLRGHPEVDQVKGLSDSIKLINDQLFEIHSRMYELSEKAKEASLQSGISLPAPRLAKDKGRETLQASLDSMRESLEVSRSERPAYKEGSITHPKPGENGKSVTINHPTMPSSFKSWMDPEAAAFFVPSGKAPTAINRIAISPWTDHPKTNKAWNELELLMPSLDEPPLPAGSLPVATGVVVIEPDDRIWIVSPTNRFGGYENTFPKGRLAGKSLSLQANAIKECYEESGLKVRIIGYLGDFKKTTTIARLYLAERVGGDPTDMGWESQAVRLVPYSQLEKFLVHESDKPIVQALQRLGTDHPRPEMIARDIGGNFVRFREAIRCFKIKYGHWPTKLAIGAETLETLEHHHLTAKGFAMLSSRLKMISQIKHVQILVADDAGNQFDYSTDNIWTATDKVTIGDVDEWLWGFRL
jgi:ADP-ribose pyrophosphatase YjhB (NUDIX family)